MKKQKQITGRILRGILLINGIVLLLTCSLFFLYEYMSFQETRVHDLTVMSRIIGSNASAALVFHDPEAATEILSALQSEAGITAAGLYDADGKLFVHFPDTLSVTSFPLVTGNDEFILKKDQLEGFHPIVLGDKKIGAVFLRVKIDALYERMQVYALLTILILLASTAIAYMLYRMLKKRMLHEVQIQTNEQRESQSTILAFNQQLEQRVEERTAQLAAVNKELESFSYSISHDLRAPLRSIHGYLNILHDEYSTSLDDEGRRLLGIVLQNGKRMGQLIDDLLAFSKLGRVEFSHTIIRMDELVRNLVAEQRELGVTAEFIMHPLPDGRGDQAMIRQVWTNLITNAVKYSRKAQRPVIEIGFATENDTITYYIKDNGAGFDMLYYDKLFGVFQRLHSTKEFEGTGVGLAICQRVISRHGGMIRAEGKLNEGAVFYFSLGT